MSAERADVEVLAGFVEADARWPCGMERDGARGVAAVVCCLSYLGRIMCSGRESEDQSVAHNEGLVAGPSRVGCRSAGRNGPPERIADRIRCLSAATPDCGS